MPAVQSAKDMLASELKNIHNAEQQLSRTIPRLTGKVSSDRLRSMLDRRLEQGNRLIEDVEQALDEMGAATGRAKNLAAEGLIKDATQQMQSAKEDAVRDPVMVASVQKIEHYCIAAWGTAAAMGRLMGEKQVVRTMERALKEGKKMDEELSKLAERELNPRMLQGAGGEADEEEGAGRRRARGGSRRASRSSRSSARSSRSSGRRRSR